jgi:anthranilate synthase component 2
MNVLLIDNYDSFVYNLAQLVEETGLCELRVISYDMVDESIIEGFDKIIISPGPGIPSDFPNLQKFVRRFYAVKDILGVCMGHEVIALAFGGQIHQSGKVFHGLTKKSVITDPENYIFKHVPDGFESGLYHSWALKTENFPTELKITAVAEDGIIMALQHKKYNVVGFQFHPESIMTKYGSQMVRNWLTY